VTDGSALTRVDPTRPFLVARRDAQQLTESIDGWREAGLVVRTVRGRKMLDVDGLFDEMAAAFQFPSYFGENWPAFDECLADMDWLGADNGIVVLLLEPDQVLREAPAVELEVLVRTMSHAAETYGVPIARGEWWDRPAIPFHVVLSAPGPLEPVRNRWESAGARLDELEL
jgi:hypothetical protein